MCLPAFLAFVGVVGHGMLDRYRNLKVAFLEFGGEWLFYMVGRMEHYLSLWKGQMPGGDRLPEKRIHDYVKSGRIFVAPEADDAMMLEEIGLVGEDQILYSSDFPHGEGREQAANEILDRDDLSESQKRKILSDNTVRFYGDF
jgi:predicted TIM-barrel fold metal-dependent hydrolase